MESPESLKRIVVQGISDEVLDALDQLFPERTPGLNEPIDKIRYCSGQRSVIHFLRGLKESDPC